MPSIWDALAGVGIGLGTAGSAIAQERQRAEELKRQQARDALLEREIFNRERQVEAERTGRETLATSAAGIPELAPHAPLLREKGGGDLVKMLLDLTKSRQVREEERAEREGASGVIERARGIPPTIQRGGALDLEQNPEAAGTSAMMPGRPPMTMDQVRAALAKFKIGPGIFKDMYPQDKYASSKAGIFHTGTGEVVPGTAEPEKQTEGDRRTAEIHSYLQNVRKLTPGTPAYETEFMNWRNRPLTIFPGGAGYKATDFFGGGSETTSPTASPTEPVPTVRVPPNPPAVGTEATANLADFRTLLGQLDRLEELYKKGASKYTGPVQGRLGAARNVTGIGASEEEADYRAELASIQNSIIYLKSGKQINEQEYERLRRELPEANDPEPVFRAKLARARRLVQTMLANREAEFKTRGYRGSGPTPQARPASTPAQNNDPLGIRR